MTIKRLHELTGELMEQGIPEDAEVYGWDPISEDYEEVSSLCCIGSGVAVQTDCIN